MPGAVMWWTGLRQDAAPGKAEGRPGVSGRPALVWEGVYRVTWGREGSRTRRSDGSSRRRGTVTAKVVPDRAAAWNRPTDQRG
jgi:hypothetical protein